ncbi:MAG: phospholipid/cholesterol/gamma-HCH transport system substrate-binding protein [Pseudonocardiales bacterium]|nr:phospholipid/cholesterol/gamma-HCH transport system substrate-binding protein [Pseudonocardiales bacterium]
MSGRTVRLVAATTVVGLLTSGCGVLSGGLRGVDLPGGADLGDHPYSVTIEFADVVDLVPQSLVKVDDVPVGAVSAIAVDPATWNARVTVDLNGDVELPANASARVRTTSLLGEKFVELAAPAQGATGTLAQGADIPVVRTGRAAEVEEVLGALSMLLNGGGVAQIQTISTQLNDALKGNEPQIRALLANLDTLVSGLDSCKSEITRALDGLNRLSATLADRRGQITTALDDLAPGLKELESQRAQLVDMLRSLDRLSDVATQVVNASRDDLLADLRTLQPTVAKLAASGQNLPDSLQILGSFPFTDAAQQAVAGDYANLYLTVDLDLKDLLDNLARSNQPFPGPDTPLFDRLPPTAQLLSPLIGGGTPTRQPTFPVLGPVPVPLTGVDKAHPPSKHVPATPTQRPPAGIVGKLLGGL